MFACNSDDPTACLYPFALGQGMLIGDELAHVVQRSKVVLVMMAYGEPAREFKVSRLMVLFGLSAFVVSEAQGARGRTPLWWPISRYRHPQPWPLKLQ